MTSDPPADDQAATDRGHRQHLDDVETGAGHLVSVIARSSAAVVGEQRWALILLAAIATRAQTSSTHMPGAHMPESEQH